MNTFETHTSFAAPDRKKFDELTDKADRCEDTAEYHRSEAQREKEAADYWREMADDPETPKIRLHYLRRARQCDKRAKQHDREADRWDKMAERYREKADQYFDDAWFDEI